jgi:hypothetical protein
MVECLGLFLIVICGAYMLNPANPVPNDKKNWDNLTNYFNTGYFPIHGEENSDNGERQ